jgi:hypothetical protein
MPYRMAVSARWHDPAADEWHARPERSRGGATWPGCDRGETQPGRGRGATQGGSTMAGLNLGPMGLDLGSEVFIF